MASIQKYKTRGGRSGYRIQWFDYDGTRRSRVLYLSKTDSKRIAEKLEREAREVQNGIRPRPDDSQFIALQHFAKD